MIMDISQNESHLWEVLPEGKREVIYATKVNTDMDEIERYVVQENGEVKIDEDKKELVREKVIIPFVLYNRETKEEIFSRGMKHETKNTGVPEAN